MVGSLLDGLDAALTAKGFTIAHLKVMDESEAGWVKASIVCNGGEASVQGSLDASPAAVHEILLNARAAGSPDDLQRVVETQLAAIRGTVRIRSLQCFSPSPQCQSHNAYVSERVTIHYRWLALYGVSLECERRVSLPDGEYLHCVLPDGAMGAIPVWMTDAVACAEFSAGDPLASVEALVALRTLLDSLRSSRSAGEGTVGDNEKSHEEAVDLTAPQGKQGSSSNHHTVDGGSRAERSD